MATYRFICRSRNHEEPVLIEHQCSISKMPGAVPCTDQDCGQLAKRYYPGQKFYARVPGAHGGGPATR